MNSGFSGDEKKYDSSPMITRRKTFRPSSPVSSPKSGSISFPTSLPMGGVDNFNNSSAHSQSFIDDENPYIPSRRKNPSRSKRRGLVSYVLFLVILAAAGGFFYVLHHERALMKAQLKGQEAAMQEVEVDMFIKFDSKIKTLTKENAELHHKYQLHKDVRIENQQLKDQNQRLESTIHEHKDGDSDSLELRALEEHVVSLEVSNTRLAESKKKMQENIQLMSRTALLEKHGPGPHEVEMLVRFETADGNTDSGFITLELAPIDEMPHAVYWFLEQVERKLYDGCSFHRNPGHVIQGGPVPNFLSGANDPPLEQRFQDSGFDSILFQEYSPNFPHQKYTAGYSGRPGGPNFYISTKDNTVVHGPGGQQDGAEADPCFAKVVHGFDTVDRMHQIPVTEDHAMERNVAIVFMKRIRRGESV